ncbi:response regulator [Desulfofustis limnaeus]|jgi:twitching motility two-component system response regulator PilH|uniref:Response regulator n=1 Tax=Desulfofustis limnaeus TaxID=2740163 RepID=A0ABM7WEL1_9BACT|nr:response regulator [Desulfofustis limnaeus]MDX9894128.1 response regulator [Desulfofustis sp.]BDD89434.1 response regulator [Desulfofustis limnaeus]
MSEKLILVVDDSPTDRQIAVSACQAKGYRVESAAEGEEALRKALDLKPDLILLDVILPQKNGFQVCRQLKSSPETQAIKIIMVTSKSQDSDRFWGIKQGADGYLTKPFSESELHELIAQTI